MSGQQIKNRKAFPAIPLALGDLVDPLRVGTHFSFARYGDGEWLTILGHYGRKNSNGCTFTKGLSENLRQVLSNQHPYMHAVLRIATRKNGEQMGKFVKARNLTMPWYRGDMLLDQSLKGNLFPLVEQLRKKRILYVGPNHCRNLHRDFFKYRAFIQPPPQNAILKRGTIIPYVLRTIKRKRIDVVGWSSGLAAKVFIDDVWAEYGDTVTQIDFGSMFDGYFRIPSRTYIRRGNVKWDDLLQVNTGKRKRRRGEDFRNG